MNRTLLVHRSSCRRRERRRIELLNFRQFELETGVIMFAACGISGMLGLRDMAAFSMLAGLFILSVGQVGGRR